MKSLNSDLSVKKFNEILKEGIDVGFIIPKDDLKVMIELAYNLNYSLTYLINQAELYGEEESYNN